MGRTQKTANADAPPRNLSQSTGRDDEQQDFQSGPCQTLKALRQLGPSRDLPRWWHQPFPGRGEDNH